MLKKSLKLFGSVLLGLGFSLIFFIVLLRWVNPPVTSFTLQADWSEFDRDFYNLRHYWVPAEELPENMIWAVVASEDQRFFEHHGFDVESIEEAWKDHRKGVRTRGASTISQQVSKNLFLWPAQSFIRKAIEAGITVLIELFWPKERIIEVYLNIAEFGPGIFGVGKASEVYFQRPPDRLSSDMTARLAAVLPSPKRMRVNPPSPYTRERSRWILRQMNQLTGRTFYKFEKDTIHDELTEVQTDSLAEDSTDHTTPADSLSLDILPDSLLRNFPDTHQSVEGPADSLENPSDSSRIDSSSE